MSCLSDSLLFWWMVLRRISCTMSRRSRYFKNKYRASEEEIVSDAATLRSEIEKSQRTAKTSLNTLLKRIHEKEPPQLASTEGALYVGAAGIGYTHLRLSERADTLELDKNKYLQLANSYLTISLQEVQYREGRPGIGFLIGDWGILAVCAGLAAYQRNDKEAIDLVQRFIITGERCKEENYLKCGSDEFFMGRAGFLYGAFWLNRLMQRRVVSIETMHKIARIIIISGKTYAQTHNSPCPLMYAYYGTEYLGAAHGFSAILQVLIQTPGFLDNDSETDNIVRTCVDYFLNLQRADGNFPSCMSDKPEQKEDDLVHWCHGAPGVVYLMAAAYLRWKDPRYLDSCIQTGNLVWQKGLLFKGPGICHGVAGNGYVFLLLYRLTGDERHLFRASKFADFMNTRQFRLNSRVPDSPYSLYEGFAGTICFLADLIEPNKAHFPFQDVF